MAKDDGRIYFTDLERLWVIGRDGRLQKLREQRDRHTHEMVIDGAGYIIGEDSAYIGGLYRESVWQISPEGRFRIIYGPTTRVGRGVGVIRDSRGCTYHSNQTPVTRRPLVHRRCGRQITRLVGGAAEDAAFKQELISNVAGALLDPRGGFVFRQGTSIRRIAPNGGVSTIANGLARENFGIALDRDGSLLVAEAAARRIVRIAPNGRRSIAATSARPWGPTGIATSRGMLYVLEATDYQRGVDTRMRVRRIVPSRGSAVIAVVTIPPA